MKVKRPAAVGGIRTFLTSDARMAPGKDWDYVQHFNPDKPLGPGPQFFAPMTDLPTVPADAASHLHDGDYVMGVTVEDVARAYPWYILDNTHAYNDVLADIPIFGVV